MFRDGSPESYVFGTDAWAEIVSEEETESLGAQEPDSLTLTFRTCANQRSHPTDKTIRSRAGAVRYFKAQMPFPTGYSRLSIVGVDPE